MSRLLPWGPYLGALALLLFVGASPAPVAERAYSRATWGGWIDDNQDCRDTRQEVLLRDSRKPVLWRENERGERHCDIAWGEWVDPWSGEVVNDPGKIDIDHQVPLAEAWRSGGRLWSSSRRATYANDLGFPGHLRATSQATNRAKGDQSPDRWKPPKPESWCAYALTWSGIKLTWGLRTTAAERAAVREMLQTCRISAAPLTPPP